jgi:hypothetical protein
MVLYFTNFISSIFSLCFFPNFPIVLLFIYLYNLFVLFFLKGGFRRKNNVPASGQQVESARANLASSFVNGLVNTGYGTDKLMTVDDSQWVYKNKAEGKISAVASLGLIMLWYVQNAKC